MDPIALRALFAALESRRAGESAAVELPGADLRAAHLLSADLQGANLSGAQLDRAKLTGANLAGARLDEVSFTNTDLTGADLRWADLSAARLGGAQLKAADLRGARLPASLVSAGSLQGARLDAAACERSGFNEAVLLALAGAGASFEDVASFPEPLREVLIKATAHPENGPASRRPAAVEEVEAARQSSLSPSSPPSRRAPLRSIYDNDAPPSTRSSRAPSSSRSSIAPPSSRSPTAPPSSRSSRVPPSSRSSTAPPSSRSSRVPASTIDALAAGQVVLGVTLEARLGQGVASVVWWGKDADGTSVAVRRFHPPWRDVAPMRASFVRGVRAMQTLSALGERPPEIARVRRVDPDELTFVTDYVDNGTAADLLLLGWNARSVVKFCEQLCRALAVAHGAGVLHRCLKPSNILLGSELRPLITDFDMIDLPTVGLWASEVGTHALYAAPEELRGESTGGPAADIYSLGRLLHFLLSGADPDEPPADLPALRALRGQPLGLVRIVRKCTMRDPAARYAHVSELLADLARYERDDVGVAGGAFDAEPSVSRGYSAVPPAVRRRDGNSEPSLSRGYSAAPPAVRRRDAEPTGSTVRPSVAPAKERTSGVHGVHAARVAPASAPRSPSRLVELSLALVGVLGVLAVALMIALIEVPSAGLIALTRLMSALAAALLTFALPNFGLPVFGPLQDLARAVAGRVVPAVLAAVLVYGVDPSQLVVYRLRATVASGNLGERAGAVRQLALGGHRGFDRGDLAWLDLSGLDLTQASFRDANLVRTNLSGAVLVGASFDGADLTYANIRGANLVETNAARARGWELADCDLETKLPADAACVNGHPGRPAAGNAPP